MSQEAITSPGSKVINRLSMWLVAEREKCKPHSDRWQTLADVTLAIQQIRVESEEDAPPTRIEVGSIISARTKQGLVELVMNGERAQMALEKAREVRGMLDGAIEAAVSDALMFEFLTKRIGLKESEAGAALLDFRELRQGSRSTVFPN